MGGSDFCSEPRIARIFTKEGRRAFFVHGLHGQHGFKMGEEMGIAELFKNKNIVTFAALEVILFIFLLWKDFSISKSFLVLIGLSVIVVFFTFILHKISKKEKVVDLEKERSKLGIASLEVKKEGSKILLESLKKHNPNLAKLFEIFESNGIRLLEELEKKALNTKKKIYFVLESGEGSPDEVKRIMGGGTFFKGFVKEFSEKHEVYKIVIPGTNSFILMSEKEILTEDIYSDYYSFIDKKSKEILLAEKVPRVTKSILKKWLNNNITKKVPLVLMTRPYMFSVLSLIKLVSSRMKEDQYEKLLNEISKIKKSEVEVFEFKLSHFLEAVGIDFLKDEHYSTIDDKLKKIYGNKKLYLILRKKDLIKNLKNILKSNDFYSKELLNDSRLDDLFRLIESFQLNIFGMVSQNEK